MPDQQPETTDEGLRLLLSASPHIRSPESIPRIMWTVSASLIPALGWALYVFGPRTLWVVFLSILSAIAAEAACQALRKRPITISDGSAVLTGLLVAFVLPVHSPWFVPVAASVFAIAIAKQAFGGLGCNIWNPALMGRAFVLAAWTALVTVRGGWPKPFWHRLKPHSTQAAVDAITAPTPLTIAKRGLLDQKNRTDEAVAAFNRAARKHEVPAARLAEARKSLAAMAEGPLAMSRAAARDFALGVQHRAASITDLFLGRVGGCIGEVSALALLIGGIALIALGYVKWEVPVVFIATVAVLSLLFPLGVRGVEFAPNEPAGVYLAKAVTHHFRFASRPVFEVFAGGLFLGAFFMATDMVTTPVIRRGLVIFALGCGLLTVLIRRFGGYPEGVCYAILLMNTATPLIDRYTRPRVFGKGARK